MLSNRICSLGPALFFTLVFVVCASAAPLSDAADSFLHELMPEAARLALLDKIESAGDGIFGVAESDSGVYSFSSGKAPRDRDADVQSELERMEANIQALRARRALAVHLASGRLDRKRYSDDDALGGALLSIYERGGVRGLQSASGVADGWAMALVWFMPEAARAVREATPETLELNDGYCSLLYERAKNLFDGGRYSEALPVFKHIHDFKWANIGAYLDASECFLRMGEPEECRKLLKELVDALGDDMSSDELERAGRLFREAGDRESALASFKLARERFRMGK